MAAPRTWTWAASGGWRSGGDCRTSLGLGVQEVKPFGLSGSAGSTPLRITVKGDPPTHLFGKLYARGHLRADRWYKLGRYGLGRGWLLHYQTLLANAPSVAIARALGYRQHAQTLAIQLTPA